MSRQITAITRIAGVAGHPVRHSLSPIIHNAWIEAAGLDAIYLAFEPPTERFKPFVDGLRGETLLGLNVTIPFKEEAVEVADHATAAVWRIGAANLLLFRPDGAIVADNTDGIGLLESLRAGGFDPKSGPVVILGAGGAARGAAASLLDAGAPAIRLVNRNLDRARAIAAMDPNITVHAWSEATRVLEGAAAVVNATSLGMVGQPPLELSLDAAPSTAVIMDMVYRPLETDLLRQARTRGNPIADGLSMLIGQARPSFQGFFDQAPPDIDVRALCEAALAARR